MDEERERRRKRVKRIKKTIIFIIIAIIILPTILCVILFFKMNSYKNEVSDLKKTMTEYVKAREESFAIAYAGGKKEQTTESADSNNPTKELDKETDNTEPSTEVKPAPIETEAETETETETTTEAETTTETETATETETETETVFEPETIIQRDGQKELVEKALAEGRKVVYLTFDDGPCSNTGKLLDVLDKYGVKATFFINGHEGFEKELNRMVAGGHTLAMHTYSHVYESVYANVDSFAKEIDQLRQYIYKNTGLYPHIFRFPGGSSNSQTDSIQPYIDYLNKNGFLYFDWNVSSGDGGATPSVDQLYNNVMSGIEKQKVSIVLMHDSTAKMTTFEAMPRILESLQAMNALILPINDDTTPVHHNIN